MRTLALLIAGLACSASVPAAARERDTVLRTSCIGDRCAVYERGRRVGSVTADGTGRYVVRDREGKLRAKVAADPLGGLRVRTYNKGKK